MNMKGLLTLVILGLHIAIPYASAGDQGATGVVEKLHSALLDVMKNGEKIGYQGRYDQLAPVEHGQSLNMSLHNRPTRNRLYKRLNISTTPVQVVPRLVIVDETNHVVVGRDFVAVTETSGLTNEPWVEIKPLPIPTEFKLVVYLKHSESAPANVFINHLQGMEPLAVGSYSARFSIGDDPSESWGPRHFSVNEEGLSF